MSQQRKVTMEESLMGSVLRLLMSNTFISIQKMRMNNEASKIWFYDTQWKVSTRTAEVSHVTE